MKTFISVSTIAALACEPSSMAAAAKMVVVKCFMFNPI